MYCRPWIYLLFFLLTHQSLSSQSYTVKNKLYSFLECTLSNDMFALQNRSDRYFTSGLQLSYWNGQLDQGLNRLFPFQFESGAGFNTYGITAQHRIYTPFSIDYNEFHQLDRPYAGHFDLRVSNAAFDPWQKMRLQTTYQLGIIGPAAMGEQLQNTFHQIITRPPAQGWQFQLPNKLSWGANLAFQKEIAANRFSQLLMETVANIGNIQNYLQFGLHYRLGNQQKQFLPYQQMSKQWLWHSFIELQGQAVLSNYLLQGIPLNSPNNTSTGVGIYPMTFGVVHGLVVRKGMVEFRSAQHILSAEYRGGVPHFWGTLGMRLYFAQVRKKSYRRFYF